MTDAFVRARERMVQEQVIGRGIKDRRVIEAMRKIPRHKFVESALAQRCYEDGALPIGPDQTISQPQVVAYMTEQLIVTREQKVLEIGTGSGYQTAVLAELAREVCTIECVERLQTRARSILSTLHYGNVRYHAGDGSQGWPGDEMFDGVLVTAASVEIPHRLLEQLKDPGRLIIPLVRGAGQELMLAIKLKGRLRRCRLTACDFVPLVAPTHPESRPKH